MANALHVANLGSPSKNASSTVSEWWAVDCPTPNQTDAEVLRVSVEPVRKDS
jgi:hypothetical protein